MGRGAYRVLCIGLFLVCVAGLAFVTYRWAPDPISFNAFLLVAAFIALVLMLAVALAVVSQPFSPAAPPRRMAMVAVASSSGSVVESLAPSIVMESEGPPTAPWPGPVEGGISRRQVAEHVTAHAPLARSIMTEAPAGPASPRLVLAQVPVAGHRYDTRQIAMGQCGSCGTRLLAPRERPLRLECPVCHKVNVVA